MTATRTITRKLTTSANDVKAVQRAILADPAARVFICRVAGIATGIKAHVHPQYGESTGLVGQFRRVNADNTTQDAAVLWGTETLISPVAAALESGAQSVQVLADVYAVHSEKGTLGFQYVLDVHGDAAADPLSKMLGELPALPALPAPMPAAKTSKKG